MSEGVLASLGMSEGVLASLVNGVTRRRVLPSSLVNGVTRRRVLPPLLLLLTGITWPREPLLPLPVSLLADSYSLTFRTVIHRFWQEEARAMGITVGFEQEVGGRIPLFLTRFTVGGQLFPFREGSQPGYYRGLTES